MRPLIAPQPLAAGWGTAGWGTAELDETALERWYELPEAGDAAAGGPWLRLNFVASADGAATVDGRSAGLQTPADNQVFALLRDLADAVIVGAGTARAERYDALLPSPGRQRRRQRLGREAVPRLVVVSSTLDLDPDSTLFRPGAPPPIVVTHAAAPPHRHQALERVAEVVVAGRDHVRLDTALDALAGRGLRRLLCEGGPRLAASLLAAGCVDELCLTITPMLAGGGAGRILAGPALPEPARLELTHLLEADSTLLCRYRVTTGAGTPDSPRTGSPGAGSPGTGTAGSGTPATGAGPR